MSQAFTSAEAAHKEAISVSLSIQTLLDAVERGQTITADDLRIMRRDIGVLRCAVALTFHAVAHQSDERRDLPRVRPLLVEASHA